MQLDLTIPTGANFNKQLQVRDSDGIVIDLSTYTISLVFRDKYGDVILASYLSTDSSPRVINGGSLGIITISLSPTDIELLTDGFFKIELETGGVQTELVTGVVTIIKEVKSNLEYLIPEVRLKIGDLNASAYQYLDEWIFRALISAVRSSQRYFNYKYLLDINNSVYRNPNSKFLFPEPPVIEDADIPIIVILAALVLIGGTLESSTSSLASWKDAEISYSNLESGRQRKDTLDRLKNELFDYVKPPTKRLAQALKGSLPGFINNRYERTTEY